MSDVSDTAERSPETVDTGPVGRRNVVGSIPSRAATLFLKQREASVLLIAAVLFVYFTVSTTAFFSHGSFVNIAQYMAPYVIIGIPTFLAIVITVLVLGVVIGGINGIATTVFGVPSLITTLATGYIIFGYALTISAAQQVNIPTESLGLGHWFGFEAWSEIIWASVLVLIFHVILTRTRWGLYTVSVGGNVLGAREAGIRVNRIKI